MRRIACINQKGGVGKTTSTTNLGAALAEAGQRVLLVDLDPQSHLTLHLGVEPADCNPGIYEVLTDGVPVDQAMQKVRENIWLVPADTALAAAEMELVSVVGREVILRDALDAVSGKFDIMLIDCPPSLGLLTINALAAVEEVIVPMQPHFLSLQGFAKLLETVQLVATRITPGLKLTGIALCMYDTGTKLASEVAADLNAFLDAARGKATPWSGARMFETIIRRNIKLAECASMGQTIFDYAPGSNGATDYQALAMEVLNFEPYTVPDAGDAIGGASADLRAPVGAAEECAESNGRASRETVGSVDSVKDDTSQDRGNITMHQPEASSHVA